MTNNLEGKVALVTGASSGIGEATAVALGRAGASVVVAARRVERLAALEERLAAEGVKALAVELDVTDEAACRRAVERAVEAFGALDVLVNNAGVMLLGEIEGADTTDWTRMVSTNVLGPLFLTHAALPHLLDRRGSVVQVSSTAGRVARGGAGVYNATKFALNAFSEALRQEVTGRGVRVIVVEPGVVETELREHITDARARESIEGRIAGMRQLTPEDVAEAVRYAVTQPEHVAVNEIMVRPTDQVY
ncbi:SDR family NAD(P)-dependent oxidoreductase [Saccharothrix algeriensis]|uniref:NADP-dependent 3-hydroxy acid dehydrogenase YdfG n=1 Tax=Saccharothrix algeriensis TaxID=173560 RepID=A0A8T8I3J8_9PSEU|nr:SDR family NAD(P)-dependent oxidoreductase [Saccharothrix algeriensis]MBM7811641.1 NADP-dependent 3-hydroxy acid dehydrogenase YdfG [Saccharothrix algeriensis]QTR05425.1 SDR family NAD(P)-dependent oxidoreductase [Saccharothrix algeriensis]